MGTSYTLYENNFVEFSIDEMSNRLQFSIFDKTSEIIIDTPDETPEELLNRLLSGVEICSYWMDVDELKRKVMEKIKKIY